MRARSMKTPTPGGQPDRTHHELRNPDKPRASHTLTSRRVPAQTPAEVNIAMLVPLSGPWARQGILEQMGARLAVDDVNNAGGIKSMGNAKLKLVEYDTQDSAEKAKDAAQRMLAQEPDLVGGFGCWLSTFTLAAT